MGMHSSSQRRLLSAIVAVAGIGGSFYFFGYQPIEPDQQVLQAHVQQSRSVPSSDLRLPGPVPLDVSIPAPRATPDRQYYRARSAVFCRDFRRDKKQQDEAFSKTEVSEAMMQGTMEMRAMHEKTCAEVNAQDEAKAETLMEEAAKLGQKDAQIYLLEKRMKEKGVLKRIGNGTTNVSLTNAEREEMVASLKSLAYSGQRRAIVLLSETLTNGPHESRDYATAFALSLLASKDWSTAFPTSADDPAYEYIPAALRSEVIQKANSIYLQCCRNLQEPERKLSYPANLASAEEGNTNARNSAGATNNVADIFKVTR